ncbi:MAG TPA: sulfatase-like hydrolase/transferase [Verrucomicrobiae bacterium]|nr:sulfatase-like hydrolase/transferase [Verrucomicrobiae bacterium]
MSNESSRWGDAALALSIAHLSLLEAAHGQLFGRDFGYFNRVPVNRASLTALFLNIFAFGTALWLIGRFVRRINRPALFTVGRLVICLMAVIPLNFVRMHYWNLGITQFVTLMKHPLMLIGAGVIVLAVLWFHRHVPKLVMVIYLILSPMVLFTTATIGWRLIHPLPVPQNAGPPATVAARTSPRVVWLLLDELDQRIAFEAPPPSVPLPELTRFYNESFHATNAFPPGGSTLYSLPALTIGRQVRGARPFSANDLAFNGATRWSQVETVFSRARSLGFSTALVGWFHPYCRIMGNQLDHCDWYPYAVVELDRGLTVREAAVNQLCSVSPQFQQRRMHTQNVLACQKAALDTLSSPSPAAFTMLHLPGPHYPGIYDAKRGQFTFWKYSHDREYLENLVLTDKLFADLRRTLEQTGAWTNSWLIVSSDHWWRESAHYDGKTDHRVPFIIKAPAPNQSAIYDKKFDTILTYHLVLSILKGELTSAGDLAHWIDTYRTEPPVGYKDNGEPL